MIRKIAIHFFILLLLLCTVKLQAVNLVKPIPRNHITDSLKWSVDFMNKLLYSGGEWYLTDNAFKKPIQGVLNYAENEPLDTSVIDIRRFLNNKRVVYLIDRRPQDIRDGKQIQGYITDEEIGREVEIIKANVLDSLNISSIIVPNAYLEAELSKASYIPDGDPKVLLGRKMKDLPSAFVSNLNNLITARQFPSDMKGEAIDSVRYQLFDSYRKAYNDSVLNSWRERVIFTFRSKYISEQCDLKINTYKKTVSEQNFKIVSAYNDKSVSIINDSLKIALQYLTTHAEADSALIRLANLKGEKTEFWTANRDMKQIRMFLKNAQNDSLSVVLVNNGKGQLRLEIDNGIKLTRFVETQNRSITFKEKALDKKLQRVKLNKIVMPSWNLIGNGTIGFTQTSLSNWAKGGESAMALLVMSKYNANYSKDMVKWENSAEIRYGISQTKTRGLEKNDDKFELQSRFGYSAFKKWYYSAETNFRTQIARGYKFPEKENPISAFMSPGYLTVSFGLDYKPNKNFSLFLSPLTSKTTYITDTALIAPSKYGLEPGTKKFWEPGIIAKATWHRVLAENITYDTKGEFFNNYKYTFQKFAFEWEQVLIMQVNRSINARIMTQLVYDYNTKFPILDINGKEIGREPKLQFKELFTIGFTYKF